MDKLKYNNVQKLIIQNITENIMEKGSQKGFDASDILRCHDYTERLGVIEQNIFNEKRRKMWSQAQDSLLKDLTAEILASDEILKKDQTFKDSIWKLKQSRQHVEMAMKRIKKEVNVQKSYDDTLRDILRKRLEAISSQHSPPSSDVMMLSNPELIKPGVEQVIHKSSAFNEYEGDNVIIDKAKQCD